MRRLLTASKAFLLGREEGATLIEYCVVLFLIVVVTIAAMSAFGIRLGNLFSSFASSL
jgi:Flp pilus assembly pilin Flp